MRTLKEAIASRLKQRHWRFHFPGHAGQPLHPHSVFTDSVFQQDLTELPELDVLGQPSGVIADLQARYAEAYNAQASFALINGASVGLMAALLSIPQSPSSPGRVLVARNVHRSVVQGLVLTGHTPVWVLPEAHEDWGVWGALSVNSVETALAQNSDIQAVILTHPTYEGLASDITAIAALCHARGIPLIVDEAHGSLWPFMENMPASAIAAGADVVIHSLHKSAGALTQCAVAHIGANSLITPARLQQAINTLQTTSPSYLLLQSLEETLDYWTSAAGRGQLSAHQQSCRALKDWIQSSLKEIEAFDCQHNGFQLLLRHRLLDAETLATELEDTYGIAFESVNHRSVFLHINPGLSAEAFDALKKALTELDKRFQNKGPSQTRSDTFELSFSMPECHLTPRQAFLRDSKVVPLADALGHVSRQLVATCPPGIAILMPGERIQAHHIGLAQDGLDEIEIVTPFPHPQDKAVDKAPSFAYSSQYI